MWRKFAAIGLLLFLSGCITYGKDFPTSPVRNLQTNVTTQKEVFTLFGEPVRRGLENGNETWTYSYHYTEFGIPRESRELHIVFNKDGTVRSYSFTSR